jgi:hypothetical protein
MCLLPGTEVLAKHRNRGIKETGKVNFDSVRVRPLSAGREALIAGFHRLLMPKEVLKK